MYVDIAIRFMKMLRIAKHPRVPASPPFNTGVLQISTTLGIHMGIKRGVVPSHRIEYFMVGNPELLLSNFTRFEYVGNRGRFIFSQFLLPFPPIIGIHVAGKTVAMSSRISALFLQILSGIPCALSIHTRSYQLISPYRC